MNLFLAKTVPAWMSTSFPIIARICLVIIALLCLVMVVLVFMQITGGDDANNVLMGNKDSYYSHNKSGSREGRITRLVYICLGLIALFTIIYFVLIKVV